MSIRTALQTQDIKELTATVESAVKIYGGAMPKEPQVETAFGYMPLSAVYDEETKWCLVSVAYAELTQKVANLPEGSDVKVETAKLISNNAVLRHLATPTVANKGDLL